MKILILSDHFPPVSGGGAGVMAFRLAKAWQEAGNTIGVITVTPDKKKEGLTEHESLKVWRVYANYHERWRAYLSLYNPQTVGKVRQIINEFKPEVIQAHNIHYYLSYACLKSAKQSGAKVFLTAHDVMLFHYGKLFEFIGSGELSCPEKFNYRVSVWRQMRKFGRRHNPFRNLVIRRYLKYVDKIFAVSDALKDALSQNGIKNVAVIHNGINVEEWRLSNEKINEFKKKHGLVGKKIILFGGRLSAAKGGYQAILAMKSIADKIPDAVLLLAVGRNRYTDKITQIAQEQGIGNSLVFTGWLVGDELKSAYYSSDVVIVPSVCFDSFPTVILEALACGKPVVAGCFGGAREIVRHGENGYLINPLNITSLAKAISDLLMDQEKNQRFGEAGRRLIQEYYSIDTAARNYLSFFSKSLASL